jgi:hypothetical protein
MQTALRRCFHCNLVMTIWQSPTVPIGRPTPEEEATLNMKRELNCATEMSRSPATISTFLKSVGTAERTTIGQLATKLPLGNSSL